MRVIARLDIKRPFLIKIINLEGLRKIGNTNEIASDYYSQGIDEMIYALWLKIAEMRYLILLKNLY